MKMINPTKWAIAIACIGFIAFTVQPAKADSITFDLTTGNLAISSFHGPYANVLVNRTSTTTAVITFTSMTNSGNIYLIGDGSSVAVNVNAASWTVAAITGSNSGTGFSPGPYSNGGSHNVDGFGIFRQTINSFDGFTHASDTLSFNVNATSGTWTNAADVLTPNSDGLLAAAHIFVTQFPANASNGTLATGFAANTVPEPGTVSLVALGVLGLVGALRKRRLGPFNIRNKESVSRASGFGCALKT
ncbi:MAG TPA: PEP-CTERM sorting domain-containing protein [Chthoniobacterales bacterium]|nr:PEP-CTERM sorting domain-containing protein [Chthoniobacterales bacterium]